MHFWTINVFINTSSTEFMTYLWLIIRLHSNMLLGKIWTNIRIPVWCSIKETPHLNSRIIPFLSLFHNVISHIINRFLKSRSLFFIITAICLLTSCSLWLFEYGAISFFYLLILNKTVFTFLFIQILLMNLSLYLIIIEALLR